SPRRTPPSASGGRRPPRRSLERARGTDPPRRAGGRAGAHAHARARVHGGSRRVLGVPPGGHAPVGARTLPRRASAPSARTRRGVDDRLALLRRAVGAAERVEDDRAPGPRARALRALPAPAPSPAPRRP